MGYTDTLMPAADKDTVRHLSEEDRRRDGHEGKGLTFVMVGGKREVAVGDVLTFKQNSLGKRGLGVCNGDRGEVVDVKRDRISVRMFSSSTQPSPSVIAFSPRGYKNWDIGRATTHHQTQGASVDASVPVIDRSASAELVFMATSRSKYALDMVVARSVFKDLDEFVEHVSGQIGIKTTSRTYGEIVERTGGKDTMRVQNIEAQGEAANSPLRRIYEAEIKEPADALRKKRVDVLRDAYAERKNEIASEATLSLIDRLEAEKTALSEMRKEISEVYKETQPQKYITWLDEHETARNKARAIEQEREQQRKVEQQRELQHSNEKADDRDRHHEMENDHEYER